MIIRKAKLADAPAIAKVHVDAWRTTYHKLMPADFLANLSYKQRETIWVEILSSISQGNFTYVAEDENGTIIGFASGGKERSGDRLYDGELYAIYIIEQYQRQSLGYELISAITVSLIESGIRSMLVWVLADNPAYRFYERLGGRQVNQKQVEIGGVQLIEVAYAWTDMRSLLHPP